MIVALGADVAVVEVEDIRSVAVVDGRGPQKAVATLDIEVTVAGVVVVAGTNKG